MASKVTAACHPLHDIVLVATARIISGTRTHQYFSLHTGSINPINNTSDIEVGLILHLRRRIIMIMASLIMVREAVRMLHTKVQAQIMRMEDREAMKYLNHASASSRVFSGVLLKSGITTHPY